MKHTELEIQELKIQVKQMWNLVIAQLSKTKIALLENNTALALEVISQEKRVNAYELKIESDCENYIALYSPVAVDLRLALSLIKVSNTLERIGDFAEGIARHTISQECKTIDVKIIEDLGIEKMIDIVLEMLLDGYIAFETENTKLTEKIMSLDIQVDELYKNGFYILAEYIKENPLETMCALRLIIILRKVERIGDHCNNIIEDIVFYVDAEVLKHNNKTSLK
ncbi:MAG: phosphate signaling complex protein PhoU [Chitinophagales bacterium]|nr:phosphate signaling complex protein PhoU [Chitinophagales bacterium]MCZ2393529.1 phosphate signaling complex protein PhoU [Chitinophagales bacterium]